LKIVILGGGIGGLSSAIALKQAGFEVEVFERHDKPAEIGAGIVCWPNACFVLEQLGVLNQVAKASGLIKSMNRYSSQGEPLGALNILQLNNLMNYPSYSIIRRDLMEILTNRVAELKVDVHYQHEVVEVLNVGSGTSASIKFANNKVIQPDVIIGADGRMKSVARSYVNGDNKPIYQGFINWIGVFDQESPVFNELVVSDYWGVGERFGIVPVSKTKAYWAGGAASMNIDEKNPEKYKSELDLIFHKWPKVISKIISGTPLSRINKIFVHDHNPIEVWHKYNVILLGDAAHSPLPTSGQGACQALEDAWHLSNCLKSHSENYHEAFTEFTNIRRNKTTGITIGGRQLASSIFNRDEEFCRQRNIASKNTDYQNAIMGMAKGWSSGLPISV